MVRIGGPGQTPKGPEEKQPKDKKTEPKAEIPKSLLASIQDNPNALKIISTIFGVKVPPNIDMLLDDLENPKSDLARQISEQSDKFPDALQELAQTDGGLGAAKGKKKAPPQPKAKHKDSPPVPHSDPSSKGYNPDTTSPNAPPAGSPKALTDAWQIIQLIQQMPTWYQVWPGGPKPSSPADLVLELKDMQTMISKIPASDPRHQQLEDLYNKYAPLVNQFAALAKTPIGNGFTLEDLVFGATESDWAGLTGGKYSSIITAWNAYVANPQDPTLSSLFGKLTSAFNSYSYDGKSGMNAIRAKIGTFIDIQSGQTDSYLSQISNQLVAYNSTAFTLILEYALSNPSAGIDLSWVNNNVLSNFMQAMSSTFTDSTENSWISYLTSHGYSQADAKSYAQSLMSLYQMQASVLFDKYHALCSKSPYGTPDSADLNFIGHMLMDPSKLPSMPTALSGYVEMAKQFAPIAKLIPEIKAFLTQQLPKDQADLDKYNLQYKIYEYYMNQNDPSKVPNIAASIEATLKDIKGCAGLVQKISNELTTAISSVGSDTKNLLTQFFSGKIPSNATIDQTASADLSALNKAYDPNQDPDLAQINSVIQAAQGLVNASLSLAGKLAHHFPSLAADLIGPNKNLMRPPPNAQNSIWFDTSYIDTNNPVQSFQEYLEDAALSGTTELKLSFAMFSGDSTVQDFLKEIGGMANAEKMAGQYGISLSVSFGGETGGALAFPGGMTPQAFADEIYNTYLVGAKSVDFDLEGSGLQQFEANGKANIIAFFTELHKKLSANGQQLQLTVAGNILGICPRIPGAAGQPSVPDTSHGMEYLFQLQPPVIDRLNLMLYDSGTSYYITKGTPGEDPLTSKAPYAIDMWVDMLVKDMGITPSKAISMLGIDFQDGTPYNSTNPSVTRSGQDGTGAYTNQMYKEILTRLGYPNVSSMSQDQINQAIQALPNGVVANEMREVLLADVKSDYHITDPSVNFAPQAWWVDEGRAPKGLGSLLLSSEAEASLDALEHNTNPM